MVIDLHDGGYAEQLATSSDTTTHDIDELVSQIDLIASKLDRYSLAGRFSVVFSLTVLALVVSLLVLIGRDLIISIISTFGVTVSMVGGALSLFAERE